MVLIRRCIVLICLRRLSCPPRREFPRAELVKVNFFVGEATEEEMDLAEEERFDVNLPSWLPETLAFLEIFSSSKRLASGPVESSRRGDNAFVERCIDALGRGGIDPRGP
jgi:hypothetical protein